MIAIVAQDAVSSVTHALTASGLPAWVVGRVTVGARDLDGFVQGAKGVDGGAVRLVGFVRRVYDAANRDYAVFGSSSNSSTSSSVAGATYSGHFSRSSSRRAFPAPASSFCEHVVVRVRTEVLQVPRHLGVLRLLTAAPHA